MANVARELESEQPLEPLRAASRRIERLEAALLQHMRYHTLKARGHSRKELRECAEEALRLTRVAWTS